MSVQPQPDRAPASHRELGERLGLFHFSDRSPGAPYWHARGLAVVEALVALWREQNARFGFEEVRTPILHDAELWRLSGHEDAFAEGMFFVDDDERRLALKPMSCPAHATLFQQRRRSYRELPLRLAEQGLCHRREPSGSVNGVLRARQFTQDDAHVFCAPAQVAGEIDACLDAARAVYAVLGLEPSYELATRPERRVGDDAEWDEAEAELARALERAGAAYDVAEGGGAFYGPKITLNAADSRGRPWGLGTVQLDRQLPRRFGLAYRNAEDRDEAPVMLHRALLGSFERMVGILLGHHDGRFPLWLAPVGAVVLPRGADDEAWAGEVAAALLRTGVRAEVDRRPETLARRVRDAERARVPVVLVVGARERADGSVAVRRRGSADAAPMPLPALADALGREVRERRQPPD